jgi:hypothetical protein
MKPASHPAQQNVEAFHKWLLSKSDDDYRQMVHRGSLNRKEIATECGFGKSALQQNPAIRESLRALEDDLRARGVLPALDPDAESVPQQRSDAIRAARTEGRLKSVEQENAALRAEVQTLRAALKRYEVLDEVLAETGRLPR